MNNRTEITLNGKKQELVFGMIANEEFMRLQLEHNKNGISEVRDGEARINATLTTAEIIYAGAYNFAVIDRSKVPAYSDLIDSVEELYFSDEGLQQINTVIAIWQESRFGKNFLANAETVKKKLEENDLTTKTSEKPLKNKQSKQSASHTVN